MKTSIFFASAVLLSSLSFAQQTSFHSNNSGKVGLENSPSKVAARAGAQSNTETRVNANPQPTIGAASYTAHQTSGEIHSKSAASVNTAKSNAQAVTKQSTAATSTLSADVQEMNTEAATIHVEGKNVQAAQVSGGHNNKSGVTTSIKTDNHTAISAAVNQPIETPKPIVEKSAGTKTASVKTKGSAMLNSNIRPGKVQMSGATRTGLNVGL